MLTENLGAVQADRLLSDPRYSGRLDSEQLYDLVLQASGDEEQARRAMGRRASQRMEAGLKP